jgi:phosphodiesterase/alkaline phosphatase D-like protein
VLSEASQITDPIVSDYLVADDDVNDRVVAARFDGLRPNTRYYYAVEAGGRLDPTRKGQFRTFAEGPFSFEIAFSSCARVGSNGAVYDTIRALNPLLYLITGDFFYGDIQVDDPARYRADFDATLTAPAQAALYQSGPVAYIWDDHDYGANNASGTSPSRAAAIATYRQFVPHYPLDSGPGGAVYQAVTIGRVRFILTDLRSRRSPDSAPDNAAKSMMGAEQKVWFKRELLDASGRYPLIVWVSSVPWIAEAKPGGDNWSGYDTERREIGSPATRTC